MTQRSCRVCLPARMSLLYIYKKAGDFKVSLKEHLNWVCRAQACDWWRLKGRRRRKNVWLSRQEMCPSLARVFPETTGLSSSQLEYVGGDHVAVTVRMKPQHHADAQKLVQCTSAWNFKLLLFRMNVHKNLQSLWSFSSCVVNLTFSTGSLQILKLLITIHGRERLKNMYRL